MVAYNKTKVLREDLIYSELSYKITGILFNVWSEMGYGYKEKSYQKAIEHVTKSGVKYKRVVNLN